MKNIIPVPAFRRAAACAAAFLALSAVAVGVLRAADKTPPAPAPTGLTRELMGTWVHVGEPGKVEEAPAKGGFIKLRTAQHWAAIVIDPRTGLVESTHGGTWRVEGEVYQETTDYGGEHHAAIMNQTFQWKVKLDGDLMTMTPIGNPWNEVWQRVK